MGRALRVSVKFVYSYIRPLASFIFGAVFVKPYSLIWRWHRALRAAMPDINIANALKNHNVALYLAVGAAVLVTVNNVRIKSIEAEDFGQNNLLLPLLEQEFGATDEFGNLSTDPPPTDTNGDLQLPSDAPYTLTEGGAAILKPYLVTTQPGIAGRIRIEEYVVQTGDTLTAIAQRFQISVATLLWENRLTERSLLKVGQKLNILPTNGVTYRIGRGDTVAKIAQRFKVSSDDIIAFNRLSGGLTVGATIIIPGGRPVTPPAPPRPAVATPVPTAPSSAVRSSTRLQWPTVRRRITQYYTVRHGGVDIADPKGTSIYAAEDGVVEVAGWNRGGYGYYIIVDHGGGLKTLYGHNSKLLVTVGDRVTRGQQISEMGSTGRSTGPHLHFEVRVNGRRQNPLNYTR